MIYTLIFPAKNRGGINEESMSLTRYIQVYKDNPLIDQEAALATVQPDRDLHNRLLATPEQQQETMERLQRMAEMQQQQQAQAGLTQGEQAVMGRSSATIRR